MLPPPAEIPRYMSDPVFVDPPSFLKEYETQASSPYSSVYLGSLCTVK